MPAPLGHPEGCGCQVCRDYRARLEDDPRAREIAASQADEDVHAGEGVEWVDPGGDDAGGSEQRVVVEHHHHEHTEKPDPPKDGKDGKPGKPGKEGRPGKRGRSRSVLKTLGAGFVLVLVLHSFYPELNVPLVPGVACVDPTTTAALATEVVEATPAIGLPFVDLDLGEKLRDLSLWVVGSALGFVGDTVRAMATHAPSVGDIYAGLTADAEFVGRVVGFTVAAVSGEPLESLIDTGTPVADMGGCDPCPIDPPSDGAGVEVAARAALAAGWTGDDAVTAVAIAGAESGYNPKAANPTSSARGMWQTMMSYHADKYQGASWTDPAANARVAHAIYQTQGWAAWTVYTSGAYRSHLPEARAAVSAAQGADATPVAATTTVADPRVSDGGSVPTQPVALKAASFIRSSLGFTGTIGGSANSGHITNSLHYRGLALDVMTSGTEGQRIYDYFAGPGYRPFRVDNVIFEHRIYNAGRGDHAYGADDHMNHVHVDFHPAGGTGDAPAASTAGASCIAPLGAPSAGGMRVATFNILGADHTPAGSWRRRWPGVPALLSAHGVSVAGLQEVQPPQRPLVARMRGWASHGDWDAVTVWRTDKWTPVPGTASYVRVPIRPGRPDRLQPLIQLQHTNGQRVWFLNVHNSRTPRLQIIDERLEHAAVRHLSGPVVWLGDTNDRRFAAWAGNVGYRSAGTPSIDQIVGAGVGLTGGTRLPKTGVVARTSDHTLVYADLRLGSTL